MFLFLGHSAAWSNGRDFELAQWHAWGGGEHRREGRSGGGKAAGLQGEDGEIDYLTAERRAGVFLIFSIRDIYPPLRAKYKSRRVFRTVFYTSLR